MTGLQVVFWLAAALVLYTYILFPALIFLRGVLHSPASPQPGGKQPKRAIFSHADGDAAPPSTSPTTGEASPSPAMGEGGREVAAPPQSSLRGGKQAPPPSWERAGGGPMPTISLIIAAHNEAASIAARLENLLQLDYPRDRLEILIASDGSTDGTDEIVARYAGQGIRGLSLPRLGKASAINAAVAQATGEILVFSDANSQFAPNALRELVHPFVDPHVGGVAGNQCYHSPAGTSAGSTGEQSYWRFDRWLKRWQSRAGNTISATGAIYAIRRELFQPVPEGVTDDFVISTRVIAQGYRLVFASEAKAFEPVATSEQVEFGRKVRIMTRGLRGVLLMRTLLNPFRYGFYAIQLFSHKVLRRLAVFPLLVLLVTSSLLWHQGWIYQMMSLFQAGFYTCAGLGWALHRTHWGKRRLLAWPFYFCMVNAAALVATLNVLRGRQIVLWEPARTPETPATDLAKQPQ